MSIIENEIHGNTMLLTLNNPTKRNSMIKGFHDEFQLSIKRGLIIHHLTNRNSMTECYSQFMGIYSENFLKSKPLKLSK